MSEQLTRNFKRSDFACQGENCCDHSAPVHPDLARGLQELRDKAGKPIMINSAFRCNKHNKSIGGAKNSYHTKAMAADIKSPILKPKELHAIAEDIPVFRNGGIGLYKWGIHVDVRGFKARWSS